MSQNQTIEHILVQKDKQQKDDQKYDSSQALQEALKSSQDLKQANDLDKQDLNKDLQ